MADEVVQSAGIVSVKVVSTLAGPYGPLSCVLADAVTLNGEPPALDAGLLTVTLVTLTSAVAPMSVVLLPLAVLFALAGSVTCNWSIAADAVTEKLWLETVVHVTDQVIGLPGTIVGVEAGSDESCSVCGLADGVVQSGGRLSVNVVSTLAGP